MVINTQDTKFSIWGMVINIQDNIYSSREGVIKTCW